MAKEAPVNTGAPPRREYPVAWVSQNTGARSAGSDGLTVARVEAEIGVTVFLDDLRQRLREGAFLPEPVRERKMPKPGGAGKVRRLGIPSSLGKRTRSNPGTAPQADSPASDLFTATLPRVPNDDRSAEHVIAAGRRLDRPVARLNTTRPVR